MEDKEGEARRTILVVDDEDGVKRLLQRVLMRAGYRVFTAGGPDEAIQNFRHELETGSIDMLVSDVIMPRRSGLDLVREVRALRPQIPALLISGNIKGTKLSHDVLDREHLGFLAKPFKATELVAEVGRMTAETAV